MAVQKVNTLLFEITSPAVLAFPEVFTATKFKDPKTGREANDATFDATFLFRADHPDLPAIRAALLKAAADTWPSAQFADPAKPGFMDLDWALKSGDAMADAAKTQDRDAEHLRGYLVMRAHSFEKYPPGLGCVINGVLKDVPRSGEERATFSKYFYGGANVLGQVGFRGYQVGNNKPGVTAYLQVVCALGTGDRNPRLEGGSGKSASAMFSKHVGHVTSVDPTALPVGLPA